ncbi:uncharacterized protein LOC126372702 [Pectinophora gossypiella]|uniref:uncharacterized protein LOC126372702 n=1 Tax=Pectinophora gossypiella TaxID=13191 RepID=UPI00214EF0D3|nr:uncharacterized protein LOC126372702 [Pectinophora gossypiella]
MKTRSMKSVETRPTPTAAESAPAAAAAVAPVVTTTSTTAASTSVTAAVRTAPTTAASTPVTAPPLTRKPSTSRTATATSTEDSSGTTATTTTGTATTTTTATTTEESTGESTHDTTLRPKSVKRAPTAPRSSASKGRRLALLKAKEELLKKEVELAAAKIATLEAESDDDDTDIVSVSEMQERTKTWVDQLPAAEEDPSPPQPSAAAAVPPAAAVFPAATVKDHEKPKHRSIEEKPTTFDYSQLATAIASAARAVPAAIAPRSVPELPIFSGASSEWLVFKTAYEETAVYLTEQENLSRLRRSLRGAARDAAQCLFIGATTTADVMRLLSTRFGRPDALVMAELEKLRALPRLTESPRDICTFATRISNITATIRALKKTHYLHNPEVVRHVVEKMPSALRYRYYDFAAEQDEEEPDLMKLASFMERTAERCGSFAPVEATPVVDRREHTSAPLRRTMRTHHIEEKKINVTAGDNRKQCPVCEKETHHVTECADFKKTEVNERWETAKKHRLCFRCLKRRKFGHTCPTRRCDVGGCKYSHHRLLHSEPEQRASIHAGTHIEEDPVIATIASTRERKNTTALLKILPVRVSGPKGTHCTYALLDDGSTCTLIEAAVAEHIGVSGPPEPFYIEGVAGARVDAGASRRVTFDISAPEDTHSYSISARTMKNLQLSPQSVPAYAVTGQSHLEDLQDQLTYHRGTPTVLIGQDNWQLLLAHEVRREQDSQLVAARTDLGWVLHGVRHTPAGGPAHRVHHARIVEDDQAIEKLLRDHFALEVLGVEPKHFHTEEERRALETLERTTRRTNEGYETGLLWRSDDYDPPNSYEAALRRLQAIERKLDRDEEMKRRYEKQMNTLIENGYAEVAPTPPKGKTKIWYLPHFAVMNPQKPEKLRIVHDAAAKVRGVSLNDMLLSGPDLLRSLPGVLMKFRQRRVAVTADIKDMFMRISIRTEDRDMQRFLWRGNRREGPPVEYRMKSVIFGATSSPCTAIFVKNRNAEQYREEYPAAAAAIINNHYVDDYLASFDTEEEAIQVSSQVAYIHSRANYYLQKWASSSRLVLSSLAPEAKEDIVKLAPEKILGMIWYPERDTLSFNMNEARIPTDILHGERVPTKREALRTTMSLYDPLGIATPVTIQAKRIIQDTWRTGIGWDDALPTPEAEAWKKWTEHARRLSQLAVPRCYASLTCARFVELHTFVDASSSAYAAAVYWRIVDENGKIHISLIAGKGRVAPISKMTSIPRLELQAAVMGCRLARTAQEEHDIKPARRYFWSDSRTVLSWLRTGPRAYKPFVAHRVAEIAEETKTNEWRWVSTRDNPADDATRGTPKDFASEHRWFRGPPFLYRPEDTWPAEDISETIEHTNEERVHATTAAERTGKALPDITRFSSWAKLLRVTARVLQFIEKLKGRERCAAARKRTKKRAEEDPTWKKVQAHRETGRGTGHKHAPRQQRKIVPLAARYLHRARQLWIRAVQEEAFSAELEAIRRKKPLPADSRLKQLSIMIDEEGLIHLRSRIAAAADITTEQREPVILDGDHRWTRLYIKWVHTQLHHGGFETTANEVRQHYWVLRLRHAVRNELKKCQVCRIRRATPAQPSTGNHPRSRLAHHQRPFTYTGLDYFGPMTVTVGRARQKRYGVLFTCLTTRAVHLELAGSLSTDSAVMALRRFIGRRGCPTELWSDQGTNLRGADVEMKHAVEEAIQQEASARFITWKFIPPSAPFMGGAWERLVRSVKSALAVVLHERAPKEEVLTTLLVEAEHTINSRPLTHVSTSPEDPEALTPNHFILGGPSRVPMPGAFTEGDDAGRKDWRKSQRLADMFWARWVREYLPELQHRREPRASKGSISVGDLVLIADGTLPRNSWPRGVVVAAYPGPDGETRAVDVRTTKGILRRPTKKLVILPTSPPEDGEP